MSFLDEVTYNVKPGQEVPDTVKDDDVVNIGEKKKDHDGDGDIDSDDYLAARDKAIKKAMGKKVEEGKASKFLGALGIAAALLAVGQSNKSDSVLKAIDNKIEQADNPAEKAALKKLANQRLIWLDTGKGPGGDIKASDVGDVLKELAEKSCGCGQTPCKTYGKMREDKEEFNYKAPKDTDKDDIKIDPDTKFTVDLKHLIQKHMKEGKSKEDTIKFTKALMAKLHNKGEVTVDGTKIIFKELDAPQDAQLALPEPDAPDFLGSDGVDYEGGMAKSQMLKMKNYAKALCDMIDDESQLESWVQAKLTKASDYMSSVYHYLDYQKSKMNEASISGKRVNLDSLEAEDRYDDVFTYAEFEDGTPLTPAELDLLSDDEDTRYSYFGPGGKGHSPQHDF